MDGRETCRQTDVSFVAAGSSWGGGLYINVKVINFSDWGRTRRINFQALVGAGKLSGRSKDGGKSIEIMVKARW